MEGIPYNNAKVIYRAYKQQNILVPQPRTFKELALQSNTDVQLERSLRKAWEASRLDLQEKMG